VGGGDGGALVTGWSKSCMSEQRLSCIVLHVRTKTKLHMRIHILHQIGGGGGFALCGTVLIGIRQTQPPARHAEPGSRQVVSQPDDFPEAAAECRRLRSEYVVQVQGLIRLRKDPNPRMASGNLELAVKVDHRRLFLFPDCAHVRTGT